MIEQAIAKLEEMKALRPAGRLNQPKYLHTLGETEVDSPEAGCMSLWRYSVLNIRANNGKKQRLG
jgi:hypothetical protein